MKANGSFDKLLEIFHNDKYEDKGKGRFAIVEFKSFDEALKLINAPPTDRIFGGFILQFDWDIFRREVHYLYDGSQLQPISQITEQLSLQTLQIPENPIHTQDSDEIPEFNTTWERSDFKKIKQIGRGGQGDIWLVEENKTKQNYAWKEMKYFEINEKKRVDDEGKGYLVLEYCSGGDLNKYIKKMKKFGQQITDEDAWKLIAQIAQSVYPLHSNRIIHADLKPRNILLTEDMKVKLADFGLALKLLEGIDSTKMHGGTIPYQSPELLHQFQKSTNQDLEKEKEKQKDQDMDEENILENGKEKDKENEQKPMFQLRQTIASDIWSFRIIIYELLEYRNPFLQEDQKINNLSVDEFARRVVEQEPYELSPNRSDSLRTLIRRMLVKDPSKRITAEEILEWPEIKAIIMKPDEEQKKGKDEGI
ncbi:MAG: putative CAMK family protein kinase [Streblomastix strix]|uniref:non-specific serine/threonine protein kinase n=1 Tax=Streblomastix strix TaxID=222440 RepID=A0A5J4W624_9EUKA|nr:MAG: putative CAMK family protein kinase [Streblomastix strix]